MADTALEIQSGAELERFIPGTVVIKRTTYRVFTGFESPDRRCFWCGGPLKGKLKRYCYGHMQEYYRHFEWQYASEWCIERYDHRCANCGREGLHKRYGLPKSRYVTFMNGAEIVKVEEPYNFVKLEVHHIVPLNGVRVQFSAFHLPWNLICFCHDCHLEIGAAMRPEKPPVDPWDRALQAGQILLPLNIGGSNA